MINHGLSLFFSTFSNKAIKNVKKKIDYFLDINIQLKSVSFVSLQSLKDRNWKLVLGFYFESLKNSCHFSRFSLKENRNFFFCQKNWDKWQLLPRLLQPVWKKVAGYWLPKTIKVKCKNLFLYSDDLEKQMIYFDMRAAVYSNIYKKFVRST